MLIMYVYVCIKLIIPFPLFNNTLCHHKVYSAVNLYYKYNVCIMYVCIVRTK